MLDRRLNDHINYQRSTRL